MRSVDRRLTDVERRLGETEEPEGVVTVWVCEEHAECDGSGHAVDSFITVRIADRSVLEPPSAEAEAERAALVARLRRERGWTSVGAVH